MDNLDWGKEEKNIKEEKRYEVRKEERSRLGKHKARAKRGEEKRERRRIKQEERINIELTSNIQENLCWCMLFVDHKFHVLKKNK